MTNTANLKDNSNDIICWWSGGITSAVACYKAISIFGVDRCRFIMIDTENEHLDTYRFKKDCEKWYGKKIETISFRDYDKFNYINNIADVWMHHKSLNTATGAICSYVLKRKVREEWEKHNIYTYQVFGFEFENKEFKRALSMKINHNKVKPIFPLLMLGLNKKDCIDLVLKSKIAPPYMYSHGFGNNNCFNTGCVQGGIGYWQKMQREFPEQFNKMAEMEHTLTNIKGEPVTMLKDQSNEAKKIVKDTKIKWKQFIFLKKHPDYPELKTINDIKGREPEPLIDCNGFCGINDMIPRINSEQDINFTDK